MTEKNRISIEEYRREIAGQAKARKVAKVDYKAIFLHQIAALRLPEPVPEHRFTEHRNWRFDWAYLDQRIAIEYQGGNFGYNGTGRGGHASVAGLARDYEKITAASLHGWMLILIDAQTVRNGRAARWVELAFKMRAGMAERHEIAAALRREPKKRATRAPKRIGNL